MNRANIRWLIGVMSLALLGLIILQVYWIRHDFILKQQRFNQQVNDALHAVVERLNNEDAFHFIGTRVISGYHPDEDPTSVLGSNAKVPLLDSLLTEEIIGPSIVPPVPPVPPAPVEYSDEIPDSMNPDLAGFPKPDNENISISINKKGNTKTLFQLRKSGNNVLDTIMVNTRQDNIRVDSLMLKYNESMKKFEMKMERYQSGLVRLSNVMNKFAIEYVSQDRNLFNKININKLDTVIKDELQNRGVDLPYSFGVLHGMKDSMMVKDSVTNKALLRESSYKVNLYPEDIFRKPDFLCVNFPGSKTYLLSSMGLLLMSSSLFTLIIIFGFTYTISTLIRQKKISEIKNDFINNMTHEFKTPIATIGLAVDAINNPKVRDDHSKIEYYSSIIKEENRRMNVQVENILRMALLDKKELNLNMQVIDLHEIIERAIQNIQLQLESKNGKVELCFEATNNHITADATHMTNVILNLLDNAIKYTEKDVVLKIVTKNKNQGILISVSDNGIGMSEETMSRIFEKFYRVPTGNIHNVKGFGLGLSYVKAIVLAHLGAVEVKSKLGEGSRFDIYLPSTRES